LWGETRVLTVCRDNKEGVESFLQKRAPRFTGTMDDTEVSAYPWWSPINVVRRSKVEGKVRAKI
jgi:hypothetical protein